MENRTTIDCKLSEVYDKMGLLSTASKYYLIIPLDDNQSVLTITKPILPMDFNPLRVKSNEKLWEPQKYIKFYPLTSLKKDLIVVYKRQYISLDPVFVIDSRKYNEWRSGMVNYKVHVKMPFDHFVKHNSYYECNHYHKVAIVLTKEPEAKTYLSDYYRHRDLQFVWDYGELSSEDEGVNDNVDEQNLSDMEFYDKHPEHVDILTTYAEEKSNRRWEMVKLIEKKILCLKNR